MPWQEDRKHKAESGRKLRLARTGTDTDTDTDTGNKEVATAGSWQDSGQIDVLSAT